MSNAVPCSPWGGRAFSNRRSSSLTPARGRPEESRVRQRGTPVDTRLRTSANGGPLGSSECSSLAERREGSRQGRERALQQPHGSHPGTRLPGRRWSSGDAAPFAGRLPAIAAGRSHWPGRAKVDPNDLPVRPDRVDDRFGWARPQLRELLFKPGAGDRLLRRSVLTPHSRLMEEFVQIFDSAVRVAAIVIQEHPPEGGFRAFVPHQEGSSTGLASGSARAPAVASRKLGGSAVRPGSVRPPRLSGSTRSFATPSTVSVPSAPRPSGRGPLPS